MFFGNGVRRFTDGFRPRAHLPRLVSDGSRPICSTIGDPMGIPVGDIPYVFLWCLRYSEHHRCRIPQRIGPFKRHGGERCEDTRLSGSLVILNCGF